MSLRRSFFHLGIRNRPANYTSFASPSVWIGRRRFRVEHGEHGPRLVPQFLTGVRVLARGLQFFFNHVCVRAGVVGITRCGCHPSRLSRLNWL